MSNRSRVSPPLRYVRSPTRLAAPLRTRKQNLDFALKPHCSRTVDNVCVSHTLNAWNQISKL